MIIQTYGKLTLLRVHDVGTGYGPGNDFLDVEVVIALDSLPGKAFGFKLRDDAQRLLHEQMLAVLREAFARGQGVSISYSSLGNQNHEMTRVAVIRNP